VKKKHPVIIVGAGPTGLMLACELGAANVPAIVVERLPEQREEAPGMAINATVVELLEQRGLMQRLAGDGLSWPSAHFAQLWLDPAKLSEPHETTFLVPQAKLELRLEERARELGVEIRRGLELLDLSEDENGVTATLRDVSNSDEQVELSAEFLVGCDGRDSAVRALAAIGFPGVTTPFNGITGDVEVEDGHILASRMGVHQVPGGLFTVAPAGPGILRVATGEFGVEPVDANVPPTWEELCGSVARLAGIELETGRPRWLIRWGDESRLADEYRRGRVLLAGESAHVHFPLGGQSLSSNLEDAVNLGWKLAAQLAGTAAQGLVDSYQAERRPVGERACLTTQAQSALLYPMQRVAPLREIFNELIQLPAVNEYLVKLAGGLDTRYPLDPRPAAHPLVGTRLGKVSVRVADAAEAGSLASVLRADRGVLLALEADGYGVHAKPWADRVDVVGAELDPRPEAAALLLRPDGRIAWAAEPGDSSEETAQALRTALETWFGPAPA
jgi:2-polyprenyl-6-methoxyphenol hydroxylase-like FAD-dependent oxidoreductase